MNTYQINHIFHSPSLSPLSPTISINSYSQSTLTNKPHHSVTHYLSNIPYNCINHKRRRARYISSLPDGQTIYFCDKCKQLVQKQGFNCRNIDQFYRKSNCKQNIMEAAESQKKKRKNYIDDMLSKIKILYTQTSIPQRNFEEQLTDNFLRNSQHISKLFKKLQTNISNIKQAYILQNKQYEQRICKIGRQIKFKITWIEEQLLHILNKITNNMDRLIQDEQYFCFNTRLYQQNLKQRRQNILVVNQLYSKQVQSFKLINQRNSYYFIQKLQKINKILLLDDGMSEIQSRQNDQSSDATIFQEIVSQMNTNYTL